MLYKGSSGVLLSPVLNLMFLLYQSEHQFKICLYSVGDGDFAVATMKEEMNLPIHTARL